MKCGRCGNNVFDSKAYLKMSQIEQPQQEKVDKLKEDLELAKGKYGKKSEEVIDIQRVLSIENRILKVIQQCKNTL